ncbi:MAG: putative permease [Parasphingorhabdus sp.]
MSARRLADNGLLMTNLILSVLMLAGAALFAGGIYVLRKGINKKQGWLMLVAAAVMFANVGIWTIPTPESNLPVSPQSAD